MGYGLLPTLKETLKIGLKSFGRIKAKNNIVSPPNKVKVCTFITFEFEPIYSLIGFLFTYQRIDNLIQTLHKSTFYKKEVRI